MTQSALTGFVHWTHFDGPLDYRQNHCEVNVVAYSAATSACEKCKHWENAVALFYELLEHHG